MLVPATWGQAPEGKDFSRHLSESTVIPIAMGSAQLAKSAVRPSAPGDEKWQNGFNLLGTNGTIYATVADGNGNIYIGGDFTVVGNVAARNVAKWNGSTWSALGAGVGPGAVRALAVIGSTLYVGGAFSGVVGVPNTAFLAKWEANAWQAVGSSPVQGLVAALAVQGSDLYVGGWFTSAGGVPNSQGIAKWDGRAWSGFGAYQLDGVVEALAVRGSDLFIGGDFRSAGDKSGVPPGQLPPTRNVARWDGTAWQPLGTGTTGPVQSLVVQGTNVFVGGRFTDASGVPNTLNIARWDGTAWNALGAGSSQWVAALAASATGVYATGSFTGGAASSPALAHWNGSTWNTLATFTRRDANPATLTSLAVVNGSVYVSGLYQKVNDTSASNLAKWNGTAWSTLGRGLDGSVFAVAVSGSSIYIGGAFTSAGGLEANYVAKWNGANWETLGTGTNGRVRSLAVVGNDVYVGGDFTLAGGVAGTNHVARWDGTRWVALGTGIDGPVNALLAHGGDVYAAGFFQVAGGVPASSVARWRNGAWAALGLGVRYEAHALAAIGPDVYVAGNMDYAGGLVNGKGIGRWNTTTNTWSALGTGLNNRANVLLAVGTDLYVGGNFTTAGGLPAQYLAKWNGNAWSTPFPGVNSLVLSLATDGRNFYVGGELYLIAGLPPAIRLVNWNGRAWEAVSSGLSATVRTLQMTSSGQLVAGGDFQTVGDASRVTAHFGIYGTAALPVITSLTPATGMVGTRVSIVGTNLNGTTAVRFNGVEAAFTEVSATQVEAMVPMGATTGNVTVTTPNGTSNGLRFEVGGPLAVLTAQQPTVQLYPNPTSGQITIASTGLGAATAEIRTPLGQLMKTVILPPGVSSLDITDLRSGLYLLRVVAAQRTYSQRIIRSPN